MSDLTQAADTNPGAPTPSTIIRVPVTKSKGFVEIDTSTIPDDVYNEVMLQGLKVLVNRGMSKITKASTKDDAELKALANAAAAKNVEAIKTSKIKFSTGMKAKKPSGAVMTEARQLARKLIKEMMKKAGHKVSHYPASEITKLANEYLDQEDQADPKSLFAQATAMVAEREEAKTAIKFDLSSLKADPALVAKDEKRKAKPKTEGQLSAKQAGLTAKSKPIKGQSATAH